MKKIIIPDVAVQFGLGSAIDGSTLSNLWLETTNPENCNLACTYCYARGGEVLEESVTLDDWLKLLDEAKSMGVTSIGIPGAGEPFYPRAISKTMGVLNKCEELGIYTTLFTTGEFITEELADQLLQMPLELMIKGNSLVPDVQDAFVSSPKKAIKGYGLRRNNALELLVSKGFNNREQCMEQYGRKSRMALVTSVMTEGVPADQTAPLSSDDITKFVGLLESNKDLGVTQAYLKAMGEVTPVNFSGASNYMEIGFLQSFARVNNIIFDVDSVLERGRGASCHLSVKDERMKTKFQEIQRIDGQFGVHWGINTTYAGGESCDRGSRHVYIDHKGDINPCIGASGVYLGNIRDTSLKQAWESKEMEIVRHRIHVGKCADECANYVDINEDTGKPLCRSCLGRACEEVTNESLLTNGNIKTIGCWNFRDR
jgi:MoaA/NifB/PqqE/SkfB family radical SAM enzyme